MKETLNKWKNPVITILVLGIVFAAGYFYTTRNRETTDSLLVGTSSVNQVLAVDGDLLKTLGKLKKLQLDVTIFNNPVWQALHDFGRTLSPQPKGRQNPFAPLSGAVVSK